MAELQKDYPREIPIINKKLQLVNSMVVLQTKLKCQMDAILKYNAACAKAMDKLTEDLKKCSK